MINPNVLSQTLANSGTTYASPFINETQIGACVMVAGYTYFTFWIIQQMRDLHGGYKGKEKKDLDDQNKQKAKTFSDVGGCSKAKEAIAEIIQYIKDPKIFKAQGVRMPKGVLLYGPSGTGKTLIAKAAAAEAGIPVIYCSGSDFVEVFVGLGAKRIRELFVQARKLAPCMIFIDEIDAVGYARGNSNMIIGGGHREMEVTLNQLLNEMDGFEENDQIIIVAATNLNNTLDQALLRPGRFDRKIEVSLPELSDRVEIFKIHLKDVSLLHPLFFL